MATKTKPAPDMDLLAKLLDEHGYTVDSLNGRLRYATLTNRRTMKHTPMVAVRLLMPLTSAYGKEIAAHYRKADRKAGKGGR